MSQTLSNMTNTEDEDERGVYENRKSSKGQQQRKTKVNQSFQFDRSTTNRSSKPPVLKN
jgi:hypothetical protein